MINEHLIKRWYLELWNNWNKDIFPEILSPHITFRGSLGQKQVGCDGLSDYMDYIKSAFPDFHNTVEFILSENDKSFAKLRYSGTHSGEIFNIYPSDKRIAYSGTAVFTFEKDKISDVWVLGDIYGLIKQIQ